MRQKCKKCKKCKKAGTKGCRVCMGKWSEEIRQRGGPKRWETNELEEVVKVSTEN